MAAVSYHPSTPTILTLKFQSSHNTLSKLGRIRQAAIQFEPDVERLG
jgi:hypothetical protein